MFLRLVKAYLDLLRLILDKGVKKTDRTGTGTISVFGAMAKFNLAEGFPLLTTKKMHTKSIIHELLWFIKGDTNIQYLNDNGVSIWDEWADESGNLGRVYGAQWRDWIGMDPKTKAVTHTDQLTNVLKRLKERPDDRRLIVTSWQPTELDAMGLPPCHCLYQLNTEPIDDPKGRLLMEQYGGQYATPPKFRLNLTLYQRSCDTFLGVPFNIASYALLLQMIAHVSNMEPGTFTHMYGDLHIYLNHLDQVATQLQREPLGLPIMKLNPEVKDIFSFQYEDFKLINYQSHASIKAPIAV